MSEGGLVDLAPGEDGGPPAVAQMSTRMAPWPEAVVVDTSRTIEESLSVTLEHVTGSDPLARLRR